MQPDDLESALAESGLVEPKKPERSGVIGPDSVIFQAPYGRTRRLHLHRYEANGITMYRMAVWGKNYNHGEEGVWEQLRSLNFSRKAAPTFIAALKALERLMVSGA